MKRHETARISAFILLAVLSAAFILFGIMRGEPGTILTKAVHICMECIGIG